MKATDFRVGDIILSDVYGSYLVISVTTDRYGISVKCLCHGVDIRGIHFTNDEKLVNYIRSYGRIHYFIENK